MNDFDPNDERFYPLLLPLLVGGAVGFPLGYIASNNKNNQPCCQGQYPYPPYGYYPYQQYPMYYNAPQYSAPNTPQFTTTTAIPTNPSLEYNNFYFPRT